MPTDAEWSGLVHSYNKAFAAGVAARQQRDAALKLLREVRARLANSAHEASCTGGKDECDCSLGVLLERIDVAIVTGIWVAISAVNPGLGDEIMRDELLVDAAEKLDRALKEQPPGPNAVRDPAIAGLRAAIAKARGAP